MKRHQDSPSPVSRRRFLAGGALLGAGVIAPRLAHAAPGDSGGHAVLKNGRPDTPYLPADPENVIHSVCLQCNTGCGIKCKLQDGVLTKIDGNPYNPWTLLPHLDYTAPIEDTNAIDGSICPKGHSSIQTAYDPYRIRRVLKRAGRRGENKWISIPFAQAVEEICEGGRLFSSVKGEESREVEGLRSLAALSDAAASKAMGADAKAIGAEKDKAKQQTMIADFKQKYAAHLDTLIDPEHPDFGPRNNQIVVAWGRLKGGRSEIYKRFAKSLGTVNAHGHTTVCQGSLYFTCKAINAIYADGKFGGGDKFYWQADLENSRFVLFVGANLFDGNYGPPNRSVRLTTNLANGFTTIAVADPRFSKLASKAWKWLPLTPGSDAAVAMAMIRWMLENKGYNEPFLRCANKAAANAKGETSWSNASWLVRLDANGQPGAFMRAADVKVTENGETRPLVQPETRNGSDGKPYEEKFLLTMVDGNLTPVDPYDTAKAVEGDLFVDTTLPDGVRVKSALQLLLEEAQQHSIEEWCAMADVPAGDTIAIAQELARWGNKATVDLHRGPAQHTNGFYNVLAWMTVNMLLGNFDHKGGLCKATTYDTNGKGGLFDLKKHSGAISAFGISSIRHGIDYEKTTIFDGYPAKRNWYPLSSDIYEEIIPSIGDAYPYPVKALFFYMGAPTYALPAGHTNIEILCDVERLPLFIANDIVIGTTSMYADYIFPDLSFLERWEFQGSHPSIPNKVQPVRQPVIAPIPETCEVYGQKMPICFESMMMGIAERLNLSGFGDNVFGEGQHFRHMDDFYLRSVANLAFGEKTDGSQNVPDADAREMEIFLRSRRHLTPEVFDVDRWRSIVGDRMWPKVAYVLARGGRFENHAAGYKGEMLAHPYGALLNLYQEKTAKTIHSGTGEHHPGLATYLPIRDFHGQEPTALRRGHDLALITSRTISQTKSRTIANPWLTPLMPENGIQINPLDAERLGISHGQKVRVVSATNPDGAWPLGNGVSKAMIGRAEVTQTVRPGVINFFLGFGHWATGAEDVVIDGHVIKGEDRRKAGIHANAAMWVDPALKNTCMLDPVGGSVSFYDTHVTLQPVSA